MMRRIEAVDIGSTKIAAGILRDDGKILHRSECPTGAKRGVHDAVRFAVIGCGALARSQPIPNIARSQQAACREAVATCDPLLQFAAEPDKGHVRALERFVDQILGTGPEVCGVDDAVLATRVAFAAIRSANERRTVSLDES